MLTNLALVFAGLSGISSPISPASSDNGLNSLAVTETDLTNLYNQISSNNPEYTLEQIGNQIYSNYSDANATFSIYGYTITKNELLALVTNVYPHQYQTVKNCAERALQISSSLYTANELNNLDGDAFRHVYWSAILSQSVGDSAALALTTAHENDTTSLSSQMDLHNNSVGISLFSEWENKFKNRSGHEWEDIVDFIHHCVALGNIYGIFKFNDSNDRLIFTNSGQINSVYTLPFNIDTLSPSDYGFEQEYFYYSRNSNIATASGHQISTTRLRCGYIENEYIVFSPRKENCGTSYLKYIFDTPVSAINIDLTLWGQYEYFIENSCFKIVYYDSDGSEWFAMVEQGDSSFSKDRTKPITYRFNFEVPAVRVELFATSRAYGTWNKGRVCMGSLDILYANSNY